MAEEHKVKEGMTVKTNSKFSSLDLIRIMYQDTDTKPNEEKKCMENPSNEHTTDELELPDRTKTDFYCVKCDAHMNCHAMRESHIRGKRHLKNIRKLPGEHTTDELELPDRTKTDFYCVKCDAHMNCHAMWEAHIVGKRHLKNIQKLPGERPSKQQAIQIHAKAKLVDAIKNLNKPVVGLDYMTEFQRNDPHLSPRYMCYLCQTNCTWSVVIDHILTTKHRLAYLKNVDLDLYEMIKGIRLTGLYLDQLVEDQACEYETQRGCGEIEVKLEKTEIGYENNFCSGRTQKKPSNQCSSLRCPYRMW